MEEDEEDGREEYDKEFTDQVVRAFLDHHWEEWRVHAKQYDMDPEAPFDTTD